MTSSVPMTIFFYKGLTRNLEIGNTPSEFCPISRLGQVRDTKSSRNVFNGAKCQGYSLIKLPPTLPLVLPTSEFKSTDPKNLIQINTATVVSKHVF